MNPSTELQDQTLERQARKRAGAKLGWYIHATVYLCVNLVLVALSLMGGRHWYATGSGGFHQRLVERERQRIVEQRNNW